MDEATQIIEDDEDGDASIAYFLFVNHGILPHEVLKLDGREKAMIIAMAKKEKENLDKIKNK